VTWKTPFAFYGTSRVLNATGAEEENRGAGFSLFLLNRSIVGGVNDFPRQGLRHDVRA